MTTDPGDLVLDPTCGSGTTAYVAEQWGRRWITVDTSRVALALARARIMGARYPYYLLAQIAATGQIKRSRSRAHRAPSEIPHLRRYVRQGFVYERVPHVTLRDIANNAEIDVIWEDAQKELGTPQRGVEPRAWRIVGGVGDSPRSRGDLAGRNKESARPVVGSGASRGRRRSTPPSPPMPTTSSSTTSHTRTATRCASPGRSRPRASRLTVYWASTSTGR